MGRKILEDGTVELTGRDKLLADPKIREAIDSGLVLPHDVASVATETVKTSDGRNVTRMTITFDLDPQAVVPVKSATGKTYKLVTLSLPARPLAGGYKLHGSRTARAFTVGGSLNVWMKEVRGW
jgi:hypothetical protein